MESCATAYRDGGTVVAMGPDEQPKQPNSESEIEAQLAALSARVETLERQLSGLSQATSAPSQESTLPPAPPIVIAKRTPASRASLEDRIGSQLFSRIGIVALLIGATWFLKLAMDNYWIGPLGRVVAGLIAGAAVVLWSERFRRQGFPLFSYSLKAIGSGVLYLSIWAAFQLYHLLPAGVALAAMVLVTAWNAYMAWSQNSELLAAYALAGAFATPPLLATGGNHEIFLFTYILMIDIATALLVRLKSWPRLLLGAFPATVAFFILWYISVNTLDPLAPTIIFICLFFLTFIAPTIYPLKDAPSKGAKTSTNAITEILLPLANATFAALALYSVLEDTHHHDLLPWMAVLFAAVYLVLMRLPQSRVAAAVHLALTVVFLTIAIPLKASGRWITVGWLAEGVALLGVSARLSTPAAESTPASVHRVLRWLAAAALTLGFLGLICQPFWLYYDHHTAFINSRFATSLAGVAALAASAWIALHAHHEPDEPSPSWLQIAGTSIVALNLVAVLACVRELDTFWSQSSANSDADLQKALAISAFLMIYGAGLLAVGFWKRSAFIRWQALILLVFTIAKTFLYDMRSLSQGYRVVSFLGLGALLMAISFAYQKDWLSLRESQPQHKPEQITGDNQ